MTVLAALWHRGGADMARECGTMLHAQWSQAGRSEVRADAGVALGSATREPAQEAAPLVSASGAFSLVADARIDNREDFRGPLGLAEASARPLSDARLIALCLDRWGPEIIERMVGDFALAIWDNRAEQLLLARDFAGQRPLHFHEAGEIVAVASMATGLHALDFVPRDVDERRLLELLAGAPYEGNRTCFKAVSRVEPGELLTFRRHGRSSRMFWSPPTGTIQLKSHQDYADALLEKLDEAVAARLRGATAKVGTHLSGGLDSAAVTTSAAAQFSGTMVAFTAVPPERLPSLPRGRFGNEAPLAAATAARYRNIDHRLIAMPERLALEKLPELFARFERTDLNLPNLAWSEAINEAAAAEGLQVMLVGAMGNATISYAGTELLGELLAAGRVGSFLAAYAAICRRGSGMRSHLVQALKQLLPRRLAVALGRPRSVEGHPATVGVINPAFEGVGELMAWLDGYVTVGEADSVQNRVRMFSRVDPGSYIKATQLRWNIDVRDPTADRRLVEFCLQVPLGQFFRNGMPRALARTALRDRVPHAAKEGPRGLQSPHWFAMLSGAREEAGRMLERIGESALAARLLDLEKMQGLLQSWPEADSFGPPVYRYGLLRGLVVGEFIRANSLR